MKRLLIIFVLLCFGFLFAQSEINPSNKVHKIRESTVLYKLKDNLTPSQLGRFNALVNKENLIEKKELKGLKVQLVKVKGIKGKELSFSKKLLETGAVEFAEPDVLVPHNLTPNDPLFSQHWHHFTINSQSAWDETIGSNTIKVCVLDTGVDTDHEDLVANLELPGYNAYYEIDGTVEDLYGHGTGTSGVVGAVGNNATGVVGMNWNVKIVPVQISQGSITSSAYISDMAVGITWCANRGDIKVANLSYGGAQYSTISNAGQYLRDRGGLLFMSAGNGGTYHNTNTFPDYSSFVVVGATSSSDVKTSWSEYGPYIDIVAPGSSIRTTYLDGTYTYYSGTSFSSPMAAGLAALVFSINPSFTPADVEDIIFTTSVDLGDVGEDDFYGNGRIDAHAAIIEALNRTVPNDVPIAVATADILNGVAPLSVFFDGRDSNDPDGSIVSYLWDFDDGTTSTSSNLNHTFTQAGTYNVTLKVTDNNSAMDVIDTPLVITVEQSLDTIITPTNLQGLVNEEENSVTLSWDHNLINTSKFEVHRAKKRRGRYNFSKIGQTNDAVLTYKDLLVDEGNYKYLVRAVSLDETYTSDFSNEAVVVVQTGLPTDPVNPGLEAPLLEASLSGNEVTLTWTDTCEDCTYTIQRAVKTKGKASFSNFDTTDGDKFLIFDELEAGTFIYRVSATKDSDTSDYSNNVNIRIR